MGFWRCLLPFAHRNQSRLAFRCITRFQISQVNNSIADERSPVRLAYDNFDANAAGKDLPPLMILHGLFGSKRNFRELAKMFNKETGRQIVTVDARNHGDSDRSPHMSFSLMASDVYHLIQELQLSKVVLLANSMGAKTAMTFALTYPTSLDSLIVVDTSPSPKRSQFAEEVFPPGIKALKTVDLNQIKDRRDVDNVLKDVIPIEVLRSYFLKNLVKTDSGFKWKVNLEAIDDNLSEVISFPTQFPHQKFNGRALFVGGSESKYISESDYPTIYKLFPRADIKFIPDSRHWLIIEKPKEFAQTVMEFLAKDTADHQF